MDEVVPLTRKRLRTHNRDTGPPRNPARTVTPDTITSNQLREHREWRAKLAAEPKPPPVDYNNIVITNQPPYNVNPNVQQRQAVQLAEGPEASNGVAWTKKDSKALDRATRAPKRPPEAASVDSLTSSELRAHCEEVDKMPKWPANTYDPATMTIVQGIDPHKVAAVLARKAAAAADTELIERLPLNQEELPRRERGRMIKRAKPSASKPTTRSTILPDQEPISCRTRTQLAKRVQDKAARRPSETESADPLTSKERHASDKQISEIAAEPIETFDSDKLEDACRSPDDIIREPDQRTVTWLAEHAASNGVALTTEALTRLHPESPPRRRSETHSLDPYTRVDLGVLLEPDPTYGTANPVMTFDPADVTTVQWSFEEIKREGERRKAFWLAEGTASKTDPRLGPQSKPTKQDERANRRVASAQSKANTESTILLSKAQPISSRTRIKLGKRTREEGR